MKAFNTKVSSKKVSSGFIAVTVSLLAFCSSTIAAVDYDSLDRQLAKARKSGNKKAEAQVLYDLGVLQLEKGDARKAEAYVREALAIDDSLGDAVSKDEKFVPAIHTRCALGQILASQGRMDEALTIFDEAAAKAEKLNMKGEAAKIVKQIGTVYLAQNKLEKGEEYLKKSAELAKAADVHECQVAALTELSVMERKRRNLDQALAYLKQAAGVAEEQLDNVAVGRVFDEFGRVYSNMGLTEQALENFEKASKEYESAGETNLQARVLISIAELSNMDRKSEVAIANLQKASALIEKDGDEKLEARLFNALGSAKADLGAIDEARNLHKKAEKLAEKNKILHEMLTAITEQGYDNFLQGNSEKALREFLRAQKLTEKYPFQTDTKAEVMERAGMGYRSVGQNKAAIKCYLEAARLYQEAKKPVQQAVILDSVAAAFLDQGDMALFQKYHDEAQAVFKGTAGSAEPKSAKVNARAKAAMAYNYAQFCVYKNEFHNAIPAFEESLEAYKSVDNTLGHCQALRGLGLTYLMLGQAQKSKEFFEAAAVLADKIGNIESQWDCATGLGKAYLQLGDHPSAEKMLLKAVSIADKERQQLSRDSFKTAALDFREDCFLDLITLLTESKRYDQALEITEKGRARAFLDMLEGRRQSSLTNRQLAIVPANESAPDIIEKAQKLAQKEEAQKEEAPVQIAMATAPLGGFRSVTVNPKVSNVVEATVISAANAKPPDLPEIKQLIQKANTHVVEYLMTPDRIIIWVLKPDGEIADVVVVKQKASDLKNLIRDMHTTITTSPDGIEELHAFNKKRQDNLKALYGILVKPIEHLLPKEEDKVVTIVPHQAIFQVPFAALISDKGRFMVEDHTLAYLPAIGVLRATTAIDPAVKAEKNTLLAFGNPITEANKFLGKLPYAEKEVKKVAALFEQGTTNVEVGAAATKSKFRELAPKYSYIHLATHGLINQTQPMDSAVVLAPENAGDDGLLTVKDILQLPPLKAKMIVLSACQTGKGKITGDGVVGLSRAFVIAGTPSVLVSLWSVDDVMTEYQMESVYYELLKGANRAAALRKAQLKTITFMEKGLPSSRDDDDDKATNVAQGIRANPRYWAAFQLLGEYN